MPTQGRNHRPTESRDGLAVPARGPTAAAAMGEPMVTAHGRRGPARGHERATRGPQPPQALVQGSGSAPARGQGPGRAAESGQAAVRPPQPARLLQVRAPAQRQERGRAREPAQGRQEAERARPQEPLPLQQRRRRPLRQRRPLPARELMAPPLLASGA